MQLYNLNPEHLVPNPWNTNSVPPEAMTKLAASLKRHGWVKPIIARVTDTGVEILGGQHRVEAAKELGYDNVPVLILDDVSETKAKEIGLIDNARYGEDDAIGLAELLAELGGAQMMAEFLPMGESEVAALSTDIDDDEIENLLNDDMEEKHDPDVPERKVKTHQILRFKVTLEDADQIQEAIETIMSNNGFTEEDSLTNAGDALVHLVKEQEVD